MSVIDWAAKCRTYAMLVEQDVLDYETAFAYLICDARSAGWNIPAGIPTAIHLFEQALADADVARGLAESKIAWRVRPLIAEYAPVDAVMCAAERVNDQHGHALLSYEVRAVVRTEMARRMAADRPRTVRRGR